MTDFSNAVDNRIREYISIFEEELYTAMPGVIESYDTSKQEASVTPALSMLEQDGSIVEFGILPNVPVILPTIVDGGMSLPLKRGDSVLIIWSQRSIDNWQALQSAGKVSPESFRKHHQTDAFCIPGTWPTSQNPVKKYSSSGNPSSDVIVFHKAGGLETSVALKQDGSIKAENQFADIEITPTGDINVNCVNLNVISSATTNVTCTTANITASTAINSTSPVWTHTGLLAVVGAITSTVSLTAPSAIINSKELAEHDHPAGTPPGDTGVNNP